MQATFALYFMLYFEQHLLKRLKTYMIRIIHSAFHFKHAGYDVMVLLKSQ